MPREKWVHKLEVQKNTKNNLKIFYNAKEKVVPLFDDHTTIVSKANHEAKNGKRLKILTPEQMLQRLSMVLAQVKAGNASENLLNEIRKIIYSLYRAKQITKKVYNNIMNSIKL